MNLIGLFLFVSMYDLYFGKILVSKKIKFKICYNIQNNTEYFP